MFVRMRRPMQHSVGRRAIIAAVAAFAAGSTACSMHPLPEDVTHRNTSDIVEKIRCEAKVGLRDVPLGHPFLDHTAIGYDFTFDIDEHNDATSGQLAYTREGFRPDLLTLNFTGSAKRERHNKRQFRVVESLAKLKKAECPNGPKHPNWIYPIAGRIGIDELVSTYIRLERLTKFGKLGDTLPNPTAPVGLPPAAAPPGPPSPDSIVFSDKLEFTTEFTAGVNPTLMLATIGGQFRLTTGTLTTSVDRKDLHNVTVALAQDGTAVQPPALVSMAASGSFGNSRQGARKIDAVVERSAPAKDRVLYELERRRLLTEDLDLTTQFLDAVRTPAP
jgi:hypothetical protein